MVSETSNDLDRWYAFMGEEIDAAALFNFHDFDTFVRWTHFCPSNSPGDRFW
jgi:hypothetical protein